MDLSFADRFAEHERDKREAKQLELNRPQTKFPADKRLEDFDYRHQTTITKCQVNALLDLPFLDNRENRVFIGPPAVGKTHLTIEISQKAIEVGYNVRFKNALEQVEELEIVEMRGELKKKLTQLVKFDALIIDELGYLPMSRRARYASFHLVNRFYEYRTLTITTIKDFIH